MIGLPRPGSGTVRVSTGNAQADAILHGGFPANSINIIMGQPGTGKTIFAEQLLFSNANGRPVLYLSTVSEPFQKVIAYLQRFSFFDADKIGQNVVYDDVSQDLVKNGPDALLVRVRSYLRELQPAVIVIDSFKAVHDLADPGTRARRWITSLAGELTASDTTTFLVGEYATEQIARYPEFAIADGIIEFARKPLSNRDERFLRVLKLRGSGYHEGLHGLRISQNGVEVFPRLISSGLPTREVSEELIPTGFGVLDELLGGGVWRGSSSMVVGSAGAGKTTLALQFIIAGVLRGEPGVFLNFQEPPALMARLIRHLGYDGADLEARGLKLRYHSPVELHIDSIVADLFSTIEREGTRRLAIDAIGDLLAAASDSARFHDYLYALVQRASLFGVTTFVTVEPPQHSVTTATIGEAPLSYISDNIVALHFDTDRADPLRALQVLKARGSGHDLRARPFAITRAGLREAQ